MFDKGRVLLIKRRNAPAINKWAVPGGKVRAGETLQQALHREIIEETGLKIKVGEIVYVFDVIERDDHNHIIFHYVIIDFLCELTGGKLTPGDDALDVRWFSSEEIVQADVNEKTKLLLKEKYNFG